MKKKFISTIIAFFISLLAFLPLIADQATRYYRETKGISKAMKVSQEYLAERYPQYSISVTKVNYVHYDKGSKFYACYAKDKEGLEYSFNMDLDYEIDSIYVNDGRVKESFKDVIDRAMLPIKEELEGYDFEFTACPMDKASKFKTFVRIDMKGSKISTQRLAEILVPMRNQIIDETGEKYELNNFAVQYSYSDEGRDNNMLVNLVGSYKNYDMHKVEKRIKME